MIESADIAIALEPDTLWRPRGGEVRFKVISKAGATIALQRIQVCFGWSASPARPQALESRHRLAPSPNVHPVMMSGSEALYGAEVPDLAVLYSPWLNFGARSDVAYTAFYTVPIADMIVVLTLSSGGTATVLIPVGITSAIYAASLTCLCVAGFLLAGWLLVSRNSRFLLQIIASPDGFASLSQFQIMLWTVTIGASAVYVMVLSGNLIILTDGALTLLGIAGGAALASRVAPTTAVATSASNVSTQQATSGPRTPQWGDLVTVAGNIDLTRVQMLVFTLISAAFVILKVVVSYTIPDIPNNFVILMGLSNGIYIVGKNAPDRTPRRTVQWRGLTV